MPVQFLIKVFFLLFSKMLLSTQENYQLGLFDFEKTYPCACDNATECFSLEDLVRRGLEYALDSREKMQLLLQARANIGVKVGNILPQINLFSIALAVENWMVNLSYFQFSNLNLCYDATVPFVGFLFPSRWFDIAESKRLKDAERESLSSLLANSAESIQHIYFDIQSQIWSIRIIEFYKEEINRLILTLREQKNNNLRTIGEEDFAILENIKAQLEYELNYVDQLLAEIPKLETAINLDLDFDWASLALEQHIFDSVLDLTPKSYDDYIKIVLKRSPEIKNIKYLIKAAKNSKKAIYFDFFDPLTDTSLGFDTPHRIKIARSNIKILKISLENTKMQLSKSIQLALNEYNNAVGAFAVIKNSLESLPAIQDAIEENISNIHEPLDIFKIFLYFNFAKRQALNFVSLYFMYRQAQGDLNRFTWTGNIYELVKDFQVHELPDILKRKRKDLTFRGSVKKKFKRLKHGKNNDELKTVN